MSESYRISGSLPKQQLLAAFLLTAAILAYVAYRFEITGRASVLSVAAIVAVNLFAMFMFVRRYRRQRAFTTNHELVLTQDAVLLRDGALERKIPYARIQRLKVRRPPIGAHSFLLTLDDAVWEEFHGYVDMKRLIASLVRHLPADKIEGSGR